MCRSSNLLDVAQTRRPLGRRFGARKYREQDSRQNRDYRNYHKQLNERESSVGILKESAISHQEFPSALTWCRNSCSLNLSLTES